MISKKRQIKEQSIIDAAEAVFFSTGYHEATMDHVAKEAGMSKASLYFYFASREELYLAIALRALRQLIDYYYKAIAGKQDKNGFERVMATFEAYLTFSEKHFHYHEALFRYMSMIRHKPERSNDEGIRNSRYFLQLKDQHNLPLEIVVKQIDAGKKDGSISNKAPSSMIYLTNWALIAGYIKLSTFGGKERSSIYRINLQEWKEHILRTASLILHS
jgi:AcrR family transcriptional regulator